MRTLRTSTRSRAVAPVPVALGTVAVVAGCSLFYESPTVRIAAVRVTQVGLTGATAEIGLVVDNPNGFDLTATGLEYRLDFEDEPGAEGGEAGWTTIAEGESRDPVTVPGEETSDVTLSVPFRYEDVGRAVRRYLVSGELRYRLSGALRVDGPVGRIRVPFDETGDVGP